MISRIDPPKSPMTTAFLINRLDNWVIILQEFDISMYRVEMGLGQPMACQASSFWFGFGPSPEGSSSGLGYRVQTKCSST